MTPLLVELQRVLPDATVDIVSAGDSAADLFRGFANVRHSYVLSRRMVRHPIAIVRTVLRIRRARYDLAIDPCEASQSSRFLVAAANATHVLGVPRQSIAGPEDAQLARRAPAHMAQWPVFLVRHAFERYPAAPDEVYPALTVKLAPDERARGRRVLDGLLRDQNAASAKFVIGVFAEATGAKRYDQAWWERFIAAFRAECICAIVEIAPPDGRARLASGFPVFSSPSPREVAAVIANMTGFVCADSGVMHLASASGTPTVGLFSITDLAKYRPYGAQNHAIDTNGKLPQVVARLASEFMKSLIADDATASVQPPIGALAQKAASDAPRQLTEPLWPEVSE
ncbi:MAG: glycosyltransferase family 9 protein [Rhodanobacter sp.]